MPPSPQMGAFVTKNGSKAQGQARPGPGCGTFKIFIDLTVCNFGVKVILTMRDSCQDRPLYPHFSTMRHKHTRRKRWNARVQKICVVPTTNKKGVLDIP